MKANGSTHIEMWQKYSKEGLSHQDAENAILKMLNLPWMKRFQVFSDQAILLLDINAGKYLYTSPSIKNITGYDPLEFTDFNFIASLMTSREIEMTIQISKMFIEKLADLRLQPHEVLHVHSSRNVFFRKKNDTLINALQHGFTFMLNNEGLPLIEMLIVTDITAFNNKNEHFYSLALTQADGTEEILISGKLENTSNIMSAREQEILKLISMGYSSQEIGAQLHISTETVKTHRKNLLHKTNTSDGIELVRHSYAHGWL